MKVGTNGQYGSYDIVLRDSYIDGANNTIEQPNIMLENCNIKAYGNFPSGYWWFCNSNDSGISTTKSNIADALLQSVENGSIYNFLAGEIDTDDYGWIAYGYDDDVDLAEIVGKLTTSSTVSFNAFSDDIYMGETNDKFANVSLTVETKAKLSPSLPEVGVKLEANRNKRFGGDAKLTLNWQANGKAQKFLVIDAKASGTNNDNIGDNLVLKLSDAQDTQVTLVDVPDGSSLRGYISKDGTNYAKITKEKGTYWLTYLYNNEGKPAGATDNGKQEFESLF